MLRLPILAGSEKTCLSLSLNSGCPVTAEANVCLRVYSKGLQGVFNSSYGSEQVPLHVHNSV